MSQLSVGDTFYFSKSRKPNEYTGFNNGQHTYIAANSNHYSTKNDCVVSLNKAPKGAKKVITRAQRERSIKATTSIEPLKAIQAQVDANTESLEILKAAMKTQSEALQAITKVINKLGS